MVDYHAILVLLCIFSDATAQFNEEPSDTVVLDGAVDTRLNCTPSAPTIEMLWFKGSTRIVNDCGVESGYDTLYRVVSNPTTGQCDLVIINANASIAGQYKCQNSLTGDVSRLAELVILDSPPGGTQQHPIAGEQMWFECSVNYTTGTVVPFFNWTDNGQDLIIDPDSATNVSAISRAYINVPAVTTPPTANIKPVTCFMHFPPTTPRTIYTQYSWTSTAVEVQFSPINLQITGGDFTDSLFLGTVISCSADAYPSLIYYEWQNATDDNSTLGFEQTYTLTVPGNYTLQCVATNTIQNSDGFGSRNSSATTTKDVMVLDSTAPPPTTPEPQGKSCSENPGCIIPAVVLPIISVLTIITIICCCCCSNSSCPCYDRCQRCRSRNCPCDNKGKTGNADITSNNSEPQKDA